MSSIKLYSKYNKKIQINRRQNSYCHCFIPRGITKSSLGDEVCNSILQFH